MELPRLKKSGGGVFSGIKSKLGFGDPPSGYADEEDYEDYSEYDGDSDGYGGEYDGYGGEYADGYPSSSAPAATGSSPRLVSLEDVRANARIPDSLTRDPLPARRVSSSGRDVASPSGFRSGLKGLRQVERASDYLRSTHTSDLTGGEGRAGELGGLFAPTTPAAQDGTPMAASSAAPAASFDPYQAYEGAGATAHSPRRGMDVVAPRSYGDAERVAKVIKAGDVAVLSLCATPSDLSKRILDFSFGVASALDASVECVADKVFVIVRGNALTSDEMAYLHSQGVL